jgi:hypothetical protein
MGRWRIVGLMVVVLGTAGCGKPAAGSAPSGAAGGGDEAAVKETFAAVQAAIKAKDAAKTWDLLSADGRADADRAAKALQDAYAKATPEQKAQQEKDLGLSAADLGALTGQGYLKTKRFLGISKVDELPEGKLTKVTVQGDQATIDYTEPDGDKEKLSLVREGGGWKVTLPMR